MNNRKIMRKFKKSKNPSIFRKPQLLLMVLPGLTLLIVFRYLPMMNIVIAFKDYNIFAGVWNSEWIGLEHFRKLFHSPEFFKVLRNTFIISGYKILFGFPMPILLALLLNEVRKRNFKKVLQNTYYLPHFLAWTIVGGMCLDMFSLNGIINQIITALGGDPIRFLLSTKYFRFVLVITDIWKEVGWGTIIYLATLSGIDPGLYEAAEIDGAGRLQKIRYVSLPSLMQTIQVMLIMRFSTVLAAGQDQILMLYNAKVMDVADIIDTYVYRMGIAGVNYGFSTAVGLFQSLVACVFVLSANYLAKKKGGGLW